MRTKPWRAYCRWAFAVGLVVVLALALLAYGGMIEVLQGLTDYRTAEWLNVGADGVGLALGSMLTRLSPRRHHND